MTKERGRTFLYHRDCPVGQIFTGDQEINLKLQEGWKEAPYPELLAEEGSPAVSEEQKPWQKAVAARKAKAAAKMEENK